MTEERGPELQQQPRFVFYLETVVKPDPEQVHAAADIDRDVYQFESGHDAVGRPVLGVVPGSKVVWITLEDGQTSVGVMTARQEGDKLIIDKNNLITPVLMGRAWEMNTPFMKLYNQIPHEVPMSSVVIPAAMPPIR